MSTTRNELRDLIANELGILPLNQSLPTDKAARILKAYDVVYDKYSEDGLTLWGLDGDVPDRFVSSLTTVVANECLNTFSVSNDRYTRIKTNLVSADKEVRKYGAPTYTSLTEPQDF